MSGFGAVSDEGLLVLRSNLLAGLDVVAQHLEADTFGVVGEGGRAPASQSGQLTLWLLTGVLDEIEKRKWGMRVEELRVGDRVLVPATVRKVYEGVGVVELEIFNYDHTSARAAMMFRDVEPVGVEVEVVLPGEPEDGSWVCSAGIDGDLPIVFVRRDQPNRVERWFDYGVGDWVTWTTAVERGADPTLVLAARS